LKRILLTILAALSINAASAQCNNLFFSEYVEGTGNNKALEIYNPTNSPINLNNYWVMRYGNGATSATAGGITQLNGTIQAHSTFLLVNGQTTTTPTSPACDVALQNLILSPNNGMLDGVFPAPTYMNGDDAITLKYGTTSTNTTIIDIIGCIGEQPLNELGNTSPNAGWTNLPPYASMPVGYNSSIDGAFILRYYTKDKTLIRKNSVQVGISVNPAFNTFNPSSQWDSLASNTWSNLGIHNCNCPTNSCSLSIVNQPQSQSINAGSTAQFAVSANATCNYQWQTNIGFGFQNLSNASQYSGVSTNQLSVNNITANNNSQVFRCIISQGACADTSNQATLSVITCGLSINTQPQNQSSVVGSTAQFTVTATANASFLWQTNAGFGFQSLSNAGQYSGATQNILSVNSLTLTNNNQSFRCIVSLNGCTDTTNAVTLTVTTPVDVIKLIDNQKLIYPNPVNDYLYIDYSKLKTDKIEMFDLLGKIVLSEKIENGNKVNVSSLPKGIYLLKLGNSNEQKKIIKN